MPGCEGKFIYLIVCENGCEDVKENHQKGKQGMRVSRQVLYRRQTANRVAFLTYIFCEALTTSDDTKGGAGTDTIGNHDTLQFNPTHCRG